MSDDRGGWLKYVLMWDWHELALKGYPGWELAPGTKYPWFADLAIRKGKDRSSRDIAVEWDDLSEGAFYYRDWTENGLPFVNDGETYRSGFWFQLKKDHDAFKTRYLETSGSGE